VTTVYKRDRYLSTIG